MTDHTSWILSPTYLVKDILREEYMTTIDVQIDKFCLRMAIEKQNNAHSPTSQRQAYLGASPLGAAYIGR
jgi:hypothetical protein